VFSVLYCWTENTHLYFRIPQKNKQAEMRFSSFSKPTSFSSFIGWGFIWVYDNTTDRTHWIPYLLTYCHTPRSTVLLEQLSVSQLVKKLPAFYGTEGSLPRLQVPATCPYLEPAQSSPCLQSHFLKSHLIIILPSMSGSYRWSLSLRFPHKIPQSPIGATLHAASMTFFSIWLPEQYWVSSTDH
jgi:hypothetical protein